MGCSNVACAITGNDITNNDPIVVFFITPNNDHYFADRQSILYPWDKYKFASLPIRGKYDDYGGIEVDHDDKRNTTALAKLASTFPNASFFDEYSMNMGAFHEALDDHGKPHNLGLMIIQEKTYNKLASKVHPETKACYINMVKDLIINVPVEIPYKPGMTKDEIHQWADNDIAIESIRNALVFCLEDYNILMRYGAVEKRYVHILSVAFIVSRESPFASFAFSRGYEPRRKYTLDDITPLFLEQLDTYLEVKGLINSMMCLGKPINISMNMGQTTHIDLAFDFALFNAKSILENIVNEEYEYGERVADSGESYSNIDLKEKELTEWYNENIKMLQQYKDKFNE